MDLTLARTFLAIAETGSFVGAASRLHLTQTAISARIRALESHLGRKLFVRNKAGARLTSAGERFRGDAIVLVQTWERALQRVALPAGHADVISIGAELSLWNPLLVNWLAWMRRECPDVALRAEVHPATRLQRRIREGSLDLVILHNPPALAGLTAELLAEEKLVLVTTDADRPVTTDNYVHVDWGPAFDASHRAAFPGLANSAVSASFGPLALAYLLAAGGAGYFRLSAVRPHIAEGRLSIVAAAPEFAHSVQIVHSATLDAGLLERARTGLRACAAMPA